MSSHHSNSNYPMLENCRVVMSSAASGTKSPPVHLPQECLKASKEELPPVYNFSLESEILIRQADRHQDLDLQKSNSREELQRNILVRMQSVTRANEAVCIALLEDNNYDLKTSVEAFFQPQS